MNSNIIYLLIVVFLKVQSLIGPLIFILFINDFTKCKNNSFIVCIRTCTLIELIATRTQLTVLLVKFTYGKVYAYSLSLIYCLQLPKLLYQRKFANVVPSVVGKSMLYKEDTKPARIRCVVIHLLKLFSGPNIFFFIQFARKCRSVKQDFKI